MRTKTETFPLIRRMFKDQKDLADVLNKSVSYVNNRMNGRGEWSENDKRLIALEIERRTVCLQKW